VKPLNPAPLLRPADRKVGAIDAHGRKSASSTLTSAPAFSIRTEALGARKMSCALLWPGHRDLEPLSLFDHRLRVRLAVVPIPERMADGVAALDLNRRALLATLLT
jgi:hypothetical protein